MLSSPAARVAYVLCRLSAVPRPRPGDSPVVSAVFRRQNPILAR